MDSVTEFELGYIEELGFVAGPVVSMGFGNVPVLHFAVEEYHPRWGARTSNPVKSVNDRLGGFNSCLFRQITLHKAILTFICNYYNVGHQIVCRSMAWRVKSF